MLCRVNNIWVPKTGQCTTSLGPFQLVKPPEAWLPQIRVSPPTSTWSWYHVPLVPNPEGSM